MDIAVAGAGIAGLSSAAFLQRLGHKVVVFDQLATPASVGSGIILQHTGLKILSQLGLGEMAYSLGARIDRLHGTSAPSGRTVLDVRYAALGDDKHGLAMHRAALFQLLFENALQIGIEFHPSFTVSDILHCTDIKVKLISNRGIRSAKFDFVVDALGAGSPLTDKAPPSLPFGALWANVEWPGGNLFSENALEQRYRRADKMAGILPIGRLNDSGPALASFFWSIKQADLAAWKLRGLGAWKEEAATLWPELSCLIDRIESLEQLTFASYIHRTLRRPTGRRIVHIGDSYHSTSPQLGQGANMALLDAFALAASLERTNDIATALEKFTALRKRHIRLYQWMSFLFTPVYQSDSRILPLLRDVAVSPISRIWPVPKLLAAMVSGAIGSPLKKLEL